MNRIYLVSIVVLFSFFSIDKGMQQPAPARQEKNAPSLRFNTAYSIAKLLNDCEKIHKDIAKLDKNTKQYLEDLKKLIERYKIFHNGNGNLLEDPSQALFCAVELGLVEIIPDIVALGANVNATIRTAEGNITPLMFAAGPFVRSSKGKIIIDRPAAPGDLISLVPSTLKNSASLIDLLISLGANINVVNDSGWGVLHYTIRHGNLPGIKVLLENGISINTKTAQAQRNVLHLAIRSNFLPKALAFLIEKGADIDAQDNQGNTPLMDAALHGDIDAVKLLLEHGARTDLINNQGMSALQVAQGKGQQGVVKILQYYLQKNKIA